MKIFRYAFLSFLFLTAPLMAASRDLPDFSRLVVQHGMAVVNLSVMRDANRAGFSPQSSADEKSPRDFTSRYPEEDLDPADENSMGSGFIISSDGYILTCAHVIENAREIQVRLADRRELSARLVGADRRSDVALLKIDAAVLPTVVIGDTNKLQVGEWVLAIGSPFGFDSSATAGIVSAKGRTLPNENYVSFIQTDVPINPGNSGGPLFNLKGEVVGVNSQIYSGTGGFMGVSFAIPINAAMTIAAQLKTEGRVRRGWLGVSLQEVSLALARAYGLNQARGALIADILPGSPAARSDLRAGDIVLEYEGHAISRSTDLPPQVGLTIPGTRARIGLFRRDSGPRTVVVTVGELKEDIVASLSTRRDDSGKNSRYGLALSELSASQRKEMEIDAGIYVNRVETNPARDAGLRPGDVILEANGTRLSDVPTFYLVLERRAADRPVVLRVRRGMATLFLALSTAASRAP